MTNNYTNITPNPYSCFIIPQDNIYNRTNSKHNTAILVRLCTHFYTCWNLSVPTCKRSLNKEHIQYPPVVDLYVIKHSVPTCSSRSLCDKHSVPTCSRSLCDKHSVPTCISRSLCDKHSVPTCSRSLCDKTFSTHLS